MSNNIETEEKLKSSIIGDSNRLLVINDLPNGISSDALEQKMSKFGKIVNVSIVKTGPSKSRPLGLVYFREAESVLKASRKLQDPNLLFGIKTEFTLRIWRMSFYFTRPNLIKEFQGLPGLCSVGSFPDPFEKGFFVGELSFKTENDAFEAEKMIKTKPQFFQAVVKYSRTINPFERDYNMSMISQNIAPCCLKITHFPKNFKHPEIESFLNETFSVYGQILKIDISEDGKHHLFAIVQFDSQATADRVFMAYNGNPYTP